MPVRNQKITPYNSSSAGAPDKREKGESVRVSSDSTKTKSGPGRDSLLKALSGGLPAKRAGSLPASGLHPFRKHAVAERGAHYSPAGEMGKVARQGAGRGVYSYGKAPGGRGENAVPGGGPDGRGRSSNANPSGGPPNTKGSNANMYPRIPNRPGSNANPGKGQADGIGRSGNALADAFKPRFGGHKP